jgi:hypothetical protein
MQLYHLINRLLQLVSGAGCRMVSDGTSRRAAGWMINHTCLCKARCCAKEASLGSASLLALLALLIRSVLHRTKHIVRPCPCRTLHITLALAGPCHPHHDHPAPWAPPTPTAACCAQSLAAPAAACFLM